MLHTVSRIKPFSLGKIHGLLCATVTLLVGLILNAVTVFWGQRALSLGWQSITPDGQIMFHALTIKPVEILLLTCIFTVIFLVIGFFYGVILASLYNFASGITGGIQVDLALHTTRPVSVPAAMPETKIAEPAVKTASVRRPVVKKKAAKKK
ncbi:MAG: DUF3566 domain-containing protein [Candidatus Abawacabacteria bacterium]|nr:DUF3566 domain-containing protein [Candidatus Abawacabacteria bacterium]